MLTFAASSCNRIAQPAVSLLRPQLIDAARRSPLVLSLHTCLPNLHSELCKSGYTRVVCAHCRARFHSDLPSLVVRHVPDLLFPAHLPFSRYLLRVVKLRVTLPC